MLVRLSNQEGDFLRGLIRRLAGAKRHHFHIRLNTEFRADLEWWHIFLASWNGTSLRQDRLQSPDFSIWTGLGDTGVQMTHSCIVHKVYLPGKGSCSYVRQDCKLVSMTCSTDAGLRVTCSTRWDK